VSVYKVAFCLRISRITLIFFREISVIRGQIFFLFDFVDRHELICFSINILSLKGYFKQKIGGD